MIYAALALLALTQSLLAWIVMRHISRAQHRAEVNYAAAVSLHKQIRAESKELSNTLDFRLAEISRSTSNLESLAQKASELSELDAKLAIRRKKMENPSETLRDFLQDLAEGGCGIVRIDPQAVFLRGIRG